MGPWALEEEGIPLSEEAEEVPSGEKRHEGHFNTHSRPSTACHQYDDAAQRPDPEREDEAGECGGEANQEREPERDGAVAEAHGPPSRKHVQEEECEADHPCEQEREPEVDEIERGEVRIGCGKDDEERGGGDRHNRVPQVVQHDERKHCERCEEECKQQAKAELSVRK